MSRGFGRLERKPLIGRDLIPQTSHAESKSSSVTRRKKIGSWGGRRKGTGRKRKLALSSSRKIVGDYHARMHDSREFGDRPGRDAVIRDLMAKYNVTPRMVERCVAEFLPNIRMYKYAIEGDEIQPLPMRNIRKLKPGVYEEKRLRLIVDSTGKRTWIFRYRRRFTIHDMVLGGQEISFTKARELATMARRKLVAGLNPADGSWVSDALQSVKLKT